jgi:maltose alpha-D-glucosyltransferase/alpha-amylase
LRRQLADLPEDVRQMAREVLAHERQILGFEERLLEGKINASKIVIHGDYHLSQVLNTGKDFVIIDFEGEPRRSLGERRLKRSALVDVAGMLRSFDYAAGVALDLAHGEDRRALEEWAAAWVEKIGEVFLDAYLEATLGAPFIPSARADFDLLLSALWLDKAVYEISCELSYRLDHVHIPLRALRDVLAGAARFPFKTRGDE